MPPLLASRRDDRAMVGLTHVARPLLKWGKSHPLVLAAGVLPLLMVLILLVRAPTFPVRTLFGVFFVATFVPVASIAAASVGGLRAAFAVSGGILTLTLAQAVLPVRQADLASPQWDVALDRPEVRARHRLALDRSDASVKVLEQPGTRLYLYISAELPSGTVLNVVWDGHLLGRLQGPPQLNGGALPWYRLPVPWSAVRNQSVWEVIVAPASPTEGNGTPRLGAAHYFRPPGAGAHASALLDGPDEYSVDVDPDTPGRQPGRWLIELRVHDQDNQVLAVWY